MRLFLFLSVLFTTISSAQVSYPSTTIKNSLTENANAVVRLDETIVEVSALNKMQVTNHRVITIFKKAGESSIRPYAFYDPNTKLSDIQVLVYGEDGKEIEKIKKKDFHDVSAVDGGTLYGDSRVKIFQYTPTSYPYTIDFSYTYTTPNTAFLPRWVPVDDYMVSTERSVFKMNIAKELKWRFKEKNFTGYPITKKSNESSVHYEMINVPAQKKEMLSPSFQNFEPQLLVALENFHLEGVDGYAHNWSTMGKWQYSNLLVNRDKLPQSTLNFINKELAGIDNNLEKIKRIYEFVQNNTRYISVQLGIGGWQPISAEEVDRVKYGDCKGLTNYTKALLKSQGITSYYSVVHAGPSKLGMEENFAIMQGNHVILNVPNEDGDIWLECTSQDIPFGFLSDFTDDRDVLVITPEGGKIKHTEAYLNDQNLQETKAKIRLNANGDLTAEVSIVTKAIQYDQHSSILQMSVKEKDEYYKEYWDNINGLKITESLIANDKENIELTEKVSLSAQAYVSKIGEDLFFKPNAFNVSNFVPDRYRERKLPFQISRGYTDYDDFIIELPVGYKIDDLPEKVTINTDFGNYEMSIEKLNDTELHYTRKLKILNGEYPKEEYDKYREFRRAIKKSDNLKLILKK
ncbi:DUF3857 domain-containing protein [Maribacter sp. LLG6340-A2]|uniref:DUF3857 domain-containing protein n=1 Tax=Maribacter sp. LLG6340-A2 TaxID=3160834 RepID=UPI00386B3125